MAKQKNTISANQTRVASFEPSNINEEERTLEIVWTTGAAVRRWDWETGKEYIEILMVNEDAIDLTRLNKGASFLNMHNSYTLDAIIGVVERAWITNGEGRAIIRFPKDDPNIDRLWNLFRQGIIRNISVGYEVLEYIETFTEDGTRILTAARWTPLELSAVTVPADAGAGVRKKDNLRAVIINNSRSDENKENSQMSMKSRKKRDEDEEDKKKTDTEENRDDENEDDEEREDCDDDKENRDDEEDEDKKDEVRSYQRQKRIYDLCEVAGVSLSQARKYCESKRSVEQIRRELVNSRAAGSEKNSTNPYQRMNNGSIKTLSQRTAERFGRKEG